jgi:hypothetical protein
VSPSSVWFFTASNTESRIVQDGNIITASGIDFGLAVIAALLGRDEAETIQPNIWWKLRITRRTGGRGSG